MTPISALTFKRNEKFGVTEFLQAGIIKMDEQC